MWGWFPRYCRATYRWISVANQCDCYVSMGTEVCRYLCSSMCILVLHLHTFVRTCDSESDVSIKTRDQSSNP